MRAVWLRVLSATWLAAAASARANAEGLLGHYYAQEDLELTASRGNLPVPLGHAPRWLEQIFLDATTDYDLGRGTRVNYSGRLNLRAEEGLGFPNHENIRHDLREAYVSIDGGGGFFFEAGRINVKSGVALGDNPTDFLKSRTAVEPLSADPSVRREDRLGTAMVLGQFIWGAGSVTALLAPKLAHETPIYAFNDLPSANPMFDRTNAQTRLLIKASINLTEEFSPEFLLERDSGGYRYGANLTYPIGRAMIVYAEWSGGRRSALIPSALAYGLATGTLPASAFGVLAHSSARGFENELALGASYATRAGITFNAEYIFHEAGFSDGDWGRWFATGIANASNPAVTQILWYLRDYAADRQEPISRSQVFLRADWSGALLRDLHLTSFALIDAHDGSAAVQISADYYLSQDLTVGGLVDLAAGRRRSDFGSLPSNTQTPLKLTRYF